MGAVFRMRRKKCRRLGDDSQGGECVCWAGKQQRDRGSERGGRGGEGKAGGEGAGEAPTSSLTSPPSLPQADLVKCLVMIVCSNNFLDIFLTDGNASALLPLNSHTSAVSGSPTP